jgi:hypothetical protein
MFLINSLHWSSTATAGEVSDRTEGARVVQRAERPFPKDASFAYPLRPAFAGHLPRPGGGGVYFIQGKPS